MRRSTLCRHSASSVAVMRVGVIFLEMGRLGECAIPFLITPFLVLSSEWYDQVRCRLDLFSPTPLEQGVASLFRILRVIVMGVALSTSLTGLSESVFPRFGRHILSSFSLLLVKLFEPSASTVCAGSAPSGHLLFLNLALRRWQWVVLWSMPLVGLSTPSYMSNRELEKYLKVERQTVAGLVG